MFLSDLILMCGTVPFKLRNNKLNKKKIYNADIIVISRFNKLYVLCELCGCHLLSKLLKRSLNNSMFFNKQT